MESMKNKRSNLMVPRLKEEYKERVVGAMTEEFSYRNRMEVPKLQKIVISRGVGAAVADKKLVEHAIEELTLISGQKAVATLSKKDVSNFKLRKGMPIGARVTLRGDRMYEFLDRLVTAALTRAPIGIPFRNLKLETSFLESVATAF